MNPRPDRWFSAVGGGEGSYATREALVRPIVGRLAGVLGVALLVVLPMLVASTVRAQEPDSAEPPKWSVVDIF